MNEKMKIILAVAAVIIIGGAAYAVLTKNNAALVEKYNAQGRAEIDPAKAETYFLKALPLAGSDAVKSVLYSNLSNAKYNQNDVPRATEYADLAIKADPSNELGYIAYAKAAISDKALLQKNAKKVEEYLIKAIFLAPRMAEPQYWMGKLDVSFGKLALANKSYDTAARYALNDDSLSTPERAALMSDIFFDKSIVLYLQKDKKYKDFFREAFKLNPTKTLFRIRENPALKGMMQDFVSTTTKK